MKKKGVFLAIMLVVLTLCGCIGPKLPGIPPDTEPQTTYIEEQTDCSEEQTSPTEEVHLKYAIKKGIEFSDGYAWVQIKDFDKNGDTNQSDCDTVCINKAGEIQFFIDTNDYDHLSQQFMWNNTIQFRPWHDNTAIVLGNSSQKDRIYDSSGIIIFETDETYSEIICYADGYYAIMKQVKSIDKNEHYVCFLNTDGTWKNNEWNLNTDSDYREISYLGEGIFFCNQGNRFYDINTNKEFSVDKLGDPVGFFSNGKIIWSGVMEYYTVDKKGNVSELLKYHSDSVAETLGFQGRYAVFETQNSLKCYDSQTDTIKEIVSFSNGIRLTSMGNCAFDGEKICADLEGLDKKAYFTTYDISGKQLYEPILCDEHTMYSSCDRIVMQLNQEYYVYDYEGNLIFKFDRSKFSSGELNPYFNDVALVGYLSSHNNNIYTYIDKDGNVLFDKLIYKTNEYLIDT